MPWVTTGIAATVGFAEWKDSPGRLGRKCGEIDGAAVDQMYEAIGECPASTIFAGPVGVN